jgi:hypothetical protein
MHLLTLPFQYRSGAKFVYLYTKMYLLIPCIVYDRFIHPAPILKTSILLNVKIISEDRLENQQIFKIKGHFFCFFMYDIQHCFICQPSDSTVSEDAGIEPMTVAILA